MKFYVYVSDTKVDMLYEQIPHRLRDELATELKIDLKLLSTAFSQQPSEKTRFSKLRMVTDFIEKNEQIGTVDAPASLFRGIMEMHWGPVGGFHDAKTVYFGGETDNTILGLGGSLKHVIGETGESNPPDCPPGSHLPYLTTALTSDYLSRYTRDGKEETEMQILYVIGWATQSMTGPTQKLEFLAKRLLEGNGPYKFDVYEIPPKHVLLGSPVYVALAD